MNQIITSKASSVWLEMPLLRQVAVEDPYDFSTLWLDPEREGKANRQMLLFQVFLQRHSSSTGKWWYDGGNFLLLIRGYERETVQRKNNRSVRKAEIVRLPPTPRAVKGRGYIRVNPQKLTSRSSLE